jgi:lysyl-tRNA synthetase class 2
VRLTGLPLIALAALATVAAGAATYRVWSRWVPARVAGVLLVEALAVVTVGLIVNRQAEFYPSWQALRGDTGTVATTAPVAAGRLDAQSTTAPFRWHPAGLAAWHLSQPPLVTLPGDYRSRPGVSFPVVLSVGAATTRTPSVVTVTIAPTARTTALDLRTLPGELRHDLRVTATGWDVTGGGELGDALVAEGLGTRVHSPADLPPALAAPMKLPAA